jgi:hypothetical protein
MVNAPAEEEGKRHPEDPERDTGERAGDEGHDDHAAQVTRERGGECIPQRGGILAVALRRQADEPTPYFTHVEEQVNCDGHGGDELDREADRAARHIEEAA